MGCLVFGVNLRVVGLLSVHAFVSFFAQNLTLIPSLSEFISVFKQPTLSVVFRVSRIHQSGYVRNLYNLYIILKIMRV